MLAAKFSTNVFGDVGVHECLAVLKDTIATVHRGNLEDAEALLTAQAVALNAIFSQMSMRAQIKLGRRLDFTDCYLRLALKAQSHWASAIAAQPAAEKTWPEHWSDYMRRRPPPFVGPLADVFAGTFSFLTMSPHLMLPHMRLHLFRYIDEECFRFNTRKLSDTARVAITAASMFGKRLTFDQLTSADATC